MLTEITVEKIGKNIPCMKQNPVKIKDVENE
jgi:hypothetical protein